jgi:hypothetical protein
MSPSLIALCFATYRIPPLTLRDKRTQPLGKGEMIVLGGNAPNSTCWLLTLKRLE